LEVKKSNKYKYVSIDNNSIMFQKKDAINTASVDVSTITSNTNNTWQKNRQNEELIKNTLQGKLAEDMFIDFIAFTQVKREIEYLPYDVFRKNNFKKHAPIDGLLFQSSNAYIKNGVERILEDINNNEFGKISIETRKYLNNKRLYTVEIKSSRIPDKDYASIDVDDFIKMNQQQTLVEALRKRDFFSYPKFTRSEGREVHNYDQYCEYVGKTNAQFSNLSGDELKSAIVSHELETMCDIYTRIFLDWEHTNSIIGYLTGYALKTDFFINPKIINMPRKGKSENAIYFIYPISETNYLSTIFTDERLWA
jgi:hypothetical protein